MLYWKRDIVKSTIEEIYPKLWSTSSSDSGDLIPISHDAKIVELWTRRCKEINELDSFANLTLTLSKKRLDHGGQADEKHPIAFREQYIQKPICTIAQHMQVTNELQTSLFVNLSNVDSHQDWKRGLSSMDHDIMFRSSLGLTLYEYLKYDCLRPWNIDTETNKFVSTEVVSNSFVSTSVNKEEKSLGKLDSALVFASATLARDHLGTNYRLFADAEHFQFSTVTSWIHCHPDLLIIDPDIENENENSQDKIETAVDTIFSDPPKTPIHDPVSGAIQKSKKIVRYQNVNDLVKLALKLDSFFKFASSKKFKTIVIPRLGTMLDGHVQEIADCIMLWLAIDNPDLKIYECSFS